MGQETDPLAERSNDSSLELLFILRTDSGKLSRQQNSAVHQSIVLFFFILKRPSWVQYTILSPIFWINKSLLLSRNKVQVRKHPCSKIRWQTRDINVHDVMSHMLQTITEWRPYVYNIFVKTRHTIVLASSHLNILDSCIVTITVRKIWILHRVFSKLTSTRTVRHAREL